MNEPVIATEEKTLAQRVGESFARAASANQVAATEAILATLIVIATETADHEFVEDEVEGLVYKLENL